MSKVSIIAMLLSYLIRIGEQISKYYDGDGFITVISTSGDIYTYISKKKQVTYVSNNVIKILNIDLFV
jgi:hypothetical protein